MTTDNEKFLADHFASTCHQMHSSVSATGDPAGSGNFRVTKPRGPAMRALSFDELDELAELLAMIANAPHFATDANIKRAQALLNKAGV